ncbi:hypothetical protein F5Y19DRAFT_470487 [Xylariaceae sp. FL1651]|nr:hypothetical protein F5Y19DRAFT_470487 [Xylariaceae sp. FL1651]
MTLWIWNLKRLILSLNWPQQPLTHPLEAKEFRILAENWLPFRMPSQQLFDEKGGPGGGRSAYRAATCNQDFDAFLPSFLFRTPRGADASDCAASNNGTPHGIRCVGSGLSWVALLMKDTRACRADQTRWLRGDTDNAAQAILDAIVGFHDDYLRLVLGTDCVKELEKSWPSGTGIRLLRERPLCLQILIQLSLDVGVHYKI